MAPSLPFLHLEECLWLVSVISHRGLVLLLSLAR